MGKRILVCDNAAFIRMVMKDFLTKGGYEIAGEAANGQEAMEKTDELQPDLILLDLYLPETDGIQVLKEIRKNHDIKVIMITPLGFGRLRADMSLEQYKKYAEENPEMAIFKNAQIEMKMDMVMSGACGFVEKPINKEALLEEVKKAIG